MVVGGSGVPRTMRSISGNHVPLGVLLGAAFMLSSSWSASRLASAAETEASSATRSRRIVERAREEVREKVVYDRRYVARGIGAPPKERGACTDLVVRAFAAVGVDLQTQIQNDALAAPEAYTWISGRDGRIDHRRAPNLYVYFTRHARRLPKDLVNDRERSLRTFAPGDVVVWTYGTCPECKADHVGIVSDRVGTRGMPLVIHNAGPYATEEDALDAWPLLAHVRL